MPLLFSEGVRTGRIGLERFVDLTAANPARLYGLYPRKGCIRVGSDADLAVWDPEREVVVTQGVLHDRMDYTPFEGMVVRGWPVVTISRGEAIWMDGEVRGEAGRGRFVHRVGLPPAPLER
jgi:dihydropyrimidinase